jgi:hypothetical protein
LLRNKKLVTRKQPLRWNASSLKQPENQSGCVFYDIPCIIHEKQVVFIGKQQVSEVAILLSQNVNGLSDPKKILRKISALFSLRISLTSFLG